MPEEHLIDGSDDDFIDFTEAIERSWRLYIRHFRDEVYPMFGEQRISLGDALIIWELNRMKNAITSLADRDNGT
jgi:hypothetical protein